MKTDKGTNFVHSNTFGKICPKCGSSDVVPHYNGLLKIVSFKCNKCHAVFNTAGELIGA